MVSSHILITRLNRQAKSMIIVQKCPLKAKVPIPVSQTKQMTLTFFNYFCLMSLATCCVINAVNLVITVLFTTFSSLLNSYQIRSTTTVSATICFVLTTAPLCRQNLSTRSSVVTLLSATRTLASVTSYSQKVSKMILTRE